MRRMLSTIVLLIVILGAVFSQVRAIDVPADVEVSWFFAPADQNPIVWQPIEEGTIPPDTRDFLLEQALSFFGGGRCLSGDTTPYDNLGQDHYRIRICPAGELTVDVNFMVTYSVRDGVPFANDGIWWNDLTPEQTARLQEMLAELRSQPWPDPAVPCISENFWEEVDQNDQTVTHYWNVVFCLFHAQSTPTNAATQENGVSVAGEIYMGNPGCIVLLDFPLYWEMCWNTRAQQIEVWAGSGDSVDTAADIFQLGQNGTSLGSGDGFAVYQLTSTDPNVVEVQINHETNDAYRGVYTQSAVLRLRRGDSGIWVFEERYVIDVS